MPNQYLDRCIQPTLCAAGQGDFLCPSIRKPIRQPRRDAPPIRQAVIGSGEVGMVEEPILQNNST